MKEISLDSVTEERLQEESRSLIGLLRSRYPKLDLRRGTALRSLLVDTDSAVGAMFSMQADEQRSSSSMLELLSRDASGEPVDQEDVDAILSNFNMASVSGTRAKGMVRVSVSVTDVPHTILSGVKFHTVDGLYFTVTGDVYASPSPTSGEVTQHIDSEDAVLAWYLVPVEADETGSNGNIGQGTAMEPDTALADFVSASAYATFSGGSDFEELQKTVDRIKSSLSMRGLTTAVASEAQLRDKFDSGEHPVVAVSVCGYGNPAQRRDKHNLFGTAVGGRADIYVRNFTDLPVADIDSLEGTIDESGTTGADTRDFWVHVSHDVVPGAIFVYSVSDPDSDALSSYRFDVVYSGDVSSSWHDFQTSDSDSHELANTVWRDMDILVKGVPATGEEIVSGKRQFRVSVCSLPDAIALQDYADDGLVRNVAADFVVRGPMIVNTSVNAVVRYRFSTGFDVSKAKAEICRYVNTTGFQGRLTRSEVSSVLMNLGAASVDLFDENDMLFGYVYDAYGTRHELHGDALDVSDIEYPEGMLTPDTAVFVVEPRNIQIKTIAI